MVRGLGLLVALGDEVPRFAALVTLHILLIACGLGVPSPAATLAFQLVGTSSLCIATRRSASCFPLEVLLEVCNLLFDLLVVVRRLQPLLRH